MRGERWPVALAFVFLGCNEKFARSGNLDADLTALAKQCEPTFIESPALKRHRRTFSEGEKLMPTFTPVADAKYRAFAVGDDGLQDVNLWLVDPKSGQVLASDLTPNSVTPTIGFSVEKAGVPLQLVVEATKGTGEIIYGLFAEPPCWKGFQLTGDAVANLHDLAARCAKGMVQVGTDVQAVFKQGESRSFPIYAPKGVYRAIAVGGSGVEDVNLELKDMNGKIVAADLSNDAMPMLHPNKNFGVFQDGMFTLTVICKKGAGLIAGGIWRMP
ncbi:MAG: hypothetical protein EBZ50_13620 [Alphaproteobacteria bacterium]|nr:hypothetical protein [Alphaproteobacteria bacterium]